MPLIASAVVLIVSVLVFGKQKSLSLALLFTGTLGLGYFIANLDPFLVLWDEQYHALVAKHLAEDSLKPLLFKESVLSHDFRDWTENHIWLHKQPLFLWQIALSIELFGTNELAVRLPSVLMHATLPLIVYRIGSISLSKEAGYYGALFIAVAYFPLELVAGRYSTDHNDVAFLFYVTASLWTWFEYNRSRSWYWVILIGFFSGAAVLVKWLMGLLVFVLWAFTVVTTEFRKGRAAHSIKSMLISGVVCLITFVPWQIYIISTYPKVAAYEYQLNSRHFFEAIEGHGQSIWYHFTDGLAIIYGSGALIPYLVLLGIIVLIAQVRELSHKVFITGAVIFVYGFYTLAKTKMVSFPIIVSPFVYIGLGCVVIVALSWFRKYINKPWIVSSLAIIFPLVISFLLLNLEKIQHYHTLWKPNDNHKRMNQLIEMNFINSLEKRLPHGDYVIFNGAITENGHIPIMFYTDFLAYEFLPTKDQIEQVRAANKKVAVVDMGDIPEFILKDKRIKLLEVQHKERLIAQ